jgi:hypothetical protein
MQVKKITKKLRVSHYDAVRCQLITELSFLRKEYLIPSDMEFLTLLTLWGPIELRVFCEEAAKHMDPEMREIDLAKRAQNVRNRMVKLERRGLVVKHRKGKKIIMLSPQIDIVTDKDIYLDYNYVHIGTAES